MHDSPTQLYLQSTVDVIVANDALIPFIRDLAIEDRPISCKAQNYHAHLTVKLQCPGLALDGDQSARPIGFRWVAGSADAWRTHTASPAFINGLRAVVDNGAASVDTLNRRFERFLLS